MSKRNRALTSTHSKPQFLLLALLSSFVGLAGGLFVAEWSFRLYLGPTESDKLNKRFHAGNEKHSQFLIDPELSYRPRHNEGGKHTEFGAYPNKYDIGDSKGRTRVLFVGDSVTSRGKIVEALREVYGEAAYEYWNAGVGGYDTTQELVYYLRYNRSINADLVVLTFHNNDFWTIPAILRNEQGRLVTIPATRTGTLPGSWWLMDRSRIVQWVVFRELVQATRKPPASDRIEDSLVKLREAVEADGAVFKVILHPSLMPQEQWTKAARRSRDKAIEIFERQGITYLDLLRAMQLALADGIDIQSKPGDSVHPSLEGARYFAASLREKNLFETNSQ